MIFYDKVCLFFSEPRKVLILTFCIGIALAFVSVLFSGFIYGDAVLYTTMAHYFGLGDYSKGFLDGIPPLFPVLSGLFCKLGIPAQYSTHIVSCALCVLTIFPLYLLLCFFMDRKYAAWGCMFYLFAPKILRFGMTSLLEGTRFFFLILSVYLAFSFVKSKKNLTLIWLGISLALSALVRGEGIIFAPIILLVLILLLLKDNGYNIDSKFIIKTLGYCLFCAIVIFTVIAPRMYQVYKHTGYPLLDEREAMAVKEFSQNIKVFFASNKPIQETSSEATQTVEKIPLSQHKVVYSDPNTYSYFSLGRIRGFLDRFSVGTFELYEILFVLGVVFLLRRKEWSLEHNVMIILVILNAFIFYFAALTYRYFLINILLLMPFIISGYRLILDITKKHKIVQILFSITVLFVALGQIENGMADSLESKKKEPRRLGEWIKENKNLLINSKKNSNERLHILSFGNRPDYPFFADADFSLHRDNDFVHNLKTSEDSEADIKKTVKGFPAKYTYYTSTLLPPDKTIIPDIIVVTPPEDYSKEVAILKSIPNMQEVKTGFEDILLFKNLN